MLMYRMGYCMPIEYLNRLIKESVVANSTMELIGKFIRSPNFTHVVHRGLNMIVKANRQPDEAKQKKIQSEVNKLLAEQHWFHICRGYQSQQREPAQSRHEPVGW